MKERKVVRSIKTSRPDLAVKFYGGRVTLTVFDATGATCLCSHCLSESERSLMLRWLESIPPPPRELVSELSGETKT